MKWEITGVDPSKPAKDKARLIFEHVVSPSITGAVATFCNKHPKIIQLAILPIEETVDEDIAA